MLALLFILGVLCPLNFAALEINLLDVAVNGVLNNTYPNSFLLNQPDCTTYINQTAELLYTEIPNNQNQTTSFTVCSGNQKWFLLNDLKSNTEYRMSYKIDNNTSNILTAKTSRVDGYQQINDGLGARSGAMVVITVILSLAMVMLLVGLILTLFFFSG